MAITLRFFSFFPSVINHDESTYLLIARDMFERGKVLYSDVIDTKPPGIFLLFGIIQKITGTSILFFRFITALFVGFTAWFIYRFSLNWHGKSKVALASGLIYIFFISTWKDFGMSSNTEIFFSFFNVLGIYFLTKKKSVFLFVAGLFFGYGFIIKYTNLYDFIPIVGFFILFLGYRIKTFKQQFLGLLIIGVGFLIPFLSINIYYYYNGNFEDFKFIIYYVPLNYAQSMDLMGVMDRLVDFHAFFLPVLFFFYYVVIKNNKKLQPIKVFILIWLAFVLWSIISLGNTFPHYFVQLMLPISLLAGFYFDNPLKTKNVFRYLFNSRTGWALLGIVMLVKLYSDYNDYYKKPDYAKLVAEYINTNTTKEDVIYTGNYHQIIYFLTGKDSPTPYVHWTILYYERLKKVLHIDNTKELDKIFEQNPKYVVIDGKLKEETYVYLREILKNKYKIETSFGNKIHLYVTKGQ